MSKKEPLSNIKTGAWSRAMSLAKVGIASGAKAATTAVGTMFSSDEEKAEKLKALLLSQVTHFTKELGELKGSLMKAGQMLSMLGEHFLPPEVNSVLKSLQNQAPPLDWPVMEKQLIRQLGKEKLELLEIERKPTASASLGQVHRATIKASGVKIALKIQYPGVDDAIDGDIQALKSLLNFSKLLPIKGGKIDEILKEVRQMLRQEVDYQRELEITEQFRRDLSSDPRYVVPKVWPEFSTGRVLATSFEEGLPVDSPEVLALPQGRRNAIAEAALELYFRELFVLRKMQTDPHFGNYRVRLGGDREPDRLILFDFGAVREFPKKFMDPYTALVRASLKRDDDAAIKSSTELGFLFQDDKEELKRKFVELSYLIAEPFLVEPDEFYDFTDSDLPKRVAKMTNEMILFFKLRVPPREIIFLDRKMAGVFIFMTVMKAKLPTRRILEQYLK